MEERIARLESHFEHMQADITEVKTDIRRLDQKIDQKFESVDQQFKSSDCKIESLKDALFEFRLEMERSFSKLTLWGLTLHIALAAGLLGVMAKGFGWIK